MGDPSPRGAICGRFWCYRRTNPRAINDLLAEELPQLQSLTEQLEATACPSEATPAHQRLLAGLRTFADDLMAVQEEATLAASQGDVYQSGLLLPIANVLKRTAPDQQGLRFSRLSFFVLSGFVLI
jgi:hypothetical protein